MVDEKALAEVIAAELDIAEMVLTDPLTLRRLKAERIARAVVASLSPGSTGETEGLKLGSRLTVDGVEAVVVDWREWLCATAETRSKEHMDRLLADPEVRASLRRSAAGER